MVELSLKVEGKVCQQILERQVKIRICLHNPYLHIIVLLF